MECPNERSWGGGSGGKGGGVEGLSKMFGSFVLGFFPVRPCGPRLGSNERKASPGSANGDCRPLCFDFQTQKKRCFD